SVLTQVMAWLTQWIRQSDPKTDWVRDPLIGTLDESLRANGELAAQVSPEKLAARAFEPEDARHIQEAIWFRDISRRSHGEGFGDLARARAVFDGTLRSIRIAPDGDSLSPRPWQALVYGRGRAAHRASVFVRLGPQPGLDEVIIPIPTHADAKGISSQKS